MTTARRSLDLSNLKIQPLNNPALLDGFCCGERDIDRNVGKCWQMHSTDIGRTNWATIDIGRTLAGFYTISISPANAEYLHPDITFGRSSGHIPFIYVNYLAVREDLQGGGLGKVLLNHALRRCALVAATVGSYGVALHALNERAEALYYEYSFRKVPDAGKPPFMVLPIQTLFDLNKIVGSG